MKYHNDTKKVMHAVENRHAAHRFTAELLSRRRKSSLNHSARGRH